MMSHALVSRLRTFALRLHRNEQGDAMQVLLIAALIIVPLVILLIYFKDKVIDFFQTAINKIFNTDKASPPPAKFN
jgi:hypothetical protein